MTNVIAIVLAVSVILIAITQILQTKRDRHLERELQGLHDMLTTQHINTLKELEMCKATMYKLQCYTHARDILTTMPPRFCADKLRKTDIMLVCEQFGIATHNKDGAEYTEAHLVKQFKAKVLPKTGAK